MPSKNKEILKQNHKKWYERHYKEYYIKNRDKILSQKKEWKRKNRKKYLESAKKYNRKRYSDFKKRVKILESGKKWRNNLKKEMLNAYGNQCVCCYEKNLEFLTIDHINNDGKVHRKKVGTGGMMIYLDLRKQGWPKDKYTLLCYNCNMAKHLYKICPHKVKNGVK